MSDDLFAAGDGQTPLAPDDEVGLIPTYIATRGDLHEAEQQNILAALLRPRPSATALLDDAYLRRLHAHMFGSVWRWAGRYRQRETNIGVDPSHIAIAVRELVADVRTWLELGTFGHDEIAARFHHRLVSIHPFPNGNGRHARIAADLLLEALGSEAFTWGRNTYRGTDALRGAYLDALRAADRGDLAPLLTFARS